MKRLRPAVVVSIMIVVLLASELAVRWIEPGLSSAGTWPDGPVASQFDAISALAEDAPVDVVFAGSSMMHRAADAELFSDLTGLSSFNGALGASTNFMLEPWLMRVVVPALRPRVVVIGVASRDFNDNAQGPERPLRVLVESPGYKVRTADDWLSRLDRTLSRYSALLRERRSLRSPTNVLEAVRDRRPSVKDSDCPRSAKEERYRSNPTVASYPTTVLKDYSTGGVQMRALVDTIEELQRREIEVVLVKLPASRDYPGLHPRGQRDIDEFEAALARVLRRTGVRIWDGRFLSGTRYFRDAIHLNCSGARRFTSELARAGVAEIS